MNLSAFLIKKKTKQKKQPVKKLGINLSQTAVQLRFESPLKTEYGKQQLGGGNGIGIDASEGGHPKHTL